jgi:hypothetical protein
VAGCAEGEAVFSCATGFWKTGGAVKTRWQLPLCAEEVWGFSGAADAGAWLVTIDGHRNR